MFRNIGERSLKIYFYAFLGIIYLPLILLIIFSFNDSRRMGFPPQGFTLEWWQRFLSRPEAVTAIENSFLVASVTALIATTVGLMAALALVRHFFRGKRLATSAVVLPLSLPPIVIAVGAVVLLLAVLDVELSRLTIILGHVLLALPYTTLILMARLIGFDRSLEEAACDLGANEFTTFRKITMPIIMPGVFVALIMAFIISLEDVPVAYFLGGYDTTIPVYIFGLLRLGIGLPVATAMSAFMTGIMLVAVIISVVWTRRAEKT
jgi:spermidine/putrescine transport system permease protein